MFAFGDLKQLIKHLSLSFFMSDMKVLLNNCKFDSMCYLSDF